MGGRSIVLPAGEGKLTGKLTIPPDARGLVLLSEERSGGARSLAREEPLHVTHALEAAGVATLVLEPSPQRAGVEAIAARLLIATDWARASCPETRALGIAYFGAGMDAAAALVAAARRPDVVAAVVVRGGRLDLAEAWLEQVRAPTLLLVAGLDGEGLRLHREARYFLHCENRLEMIHDATAGLEEPHAVEDVARAACQWLTAHFPAAPASRGANA